MKNTMIALALFLTSGICYSQNAATAEETRLYGLIMQFRNQHGLQTIPISRNLTYVAQVHARDIATYPPTDPCIAHGWSQNGKWTPCCYTSNPDDAQKNCMWQKPRELTSYKGYGFEIVAMNQGGVGTISSDVAFNQWTSETPGVGGHIIVILNQNGWTKPWNAIGVSIYNGVASVWFGNEVDQ